MPSGRYKTHKVDLTGWNSQENALVWRKAWADISNDYLERAGSPERIDHRSNAERGIDELPTVCLLYTSTRRWRLYHFCGFYYPIREVIPIAIYHWNIGIVSRGKGIIRIDNILLYHGIADECSGKAHKRQR